MVKTTDLILLAGAGIGAYFVVTSINKGFQDISAGFGDIFKPFGDAAAGFTNAFNTAGESLGQATSNANDFFTLGADGAFRKSLDESVYAGYGDDFTKSNQDLYKYNQSPDMDVPLIINKSLSLQETQKQDTFVNNTLSKYTNAPSAVKTNVISNNQQAINTLKTQQAANPSNFIAGTLIPKTGTNLTSSYFNTSGTPTPPKGEFTTTNNTPSSTGSAGGEVVHRGSTSTATIKAAGHENLSSYIAAKKASGATITW